MLCCDALWWWHAIRPAQHVQQQRHLAHRRALLQLLSIAQALKRVLPGEPTSNKLRPYLPTVTKQAWHLDKQSLKGIKRQKQAAAGSAPDEGGTAAAAGAAVVAAGTSGGSKENQQQAVAP